MLIGLKNTRTKCYKVRHKKTLRIIDYKATKRNTNIGTIALEGSVEPSVGRWGEGVKALLQLDKFTLGPDATFSTEI